MSDFKIKRGDRLPALTATLKDAAGPVDLQGSTVKFFMRGVYSSALEVDGVATIVQVGNGSDGSKGKVRYDWALADTDTVGDYFAEFEVTFSDGKKLTFPNGDDYLEVSVEPDLG